MLKKRIVYPARAYMCFSAALSEYTVVLFVKTLHTAAKECYLTVLRCFQDIKAMKVKNPNDIC